MRAAIGALAVSLSLLAAPAAQGASDEYLDHEHGVRFIVDGPVLTVQLDPQAGQSPPGGRTAVATALRRNARGRRIAERLCGLVRDSGVPLGPAAVYGRDLKLRSC